MFSEDTVDVINPAKGKPFAKCPKATVAQLNEAVAAARRALPEWSALADEKRAEILNQMPGIIGENQAELARLITLEQGKTQSGIGSNFEVGGWVAWTQVTASLKLETELVNEVLPPSVLNIVAGSSDIGNAMSAHKGIDKMVFTGSIPVGQTIMGRAACNLKSLTLELGGNDAGIILPGTDITPLLEPLFWGCFINAGQTCAALKRLYVHEDDYEEVCRKFTEYVGQLSGSNATA